MRKVFFPCLIILFCAAAAICQYLVRADGDRGNIFTLPCVFPNHFWWNIGLINNFVDPLTYRDCVRGEDQGGSLHIGHGSQPDNSLTCATGEHYDATSPAWCAPGIECGRGCALIRTWGKCLSLDCLWTQF